MTYNVFFSGDVKPHSTSTSTATTVIWLLQSYLYMTSIIVTELWHYSASSCIHNTHKLKRIGRLYINLKKLYNACSVITTLCFLIDDLDIFFHSVCELCIVRFKFWPRIGRCTITPRNINNTRKNGKCDALQSERRRRASCSMCRPLS